MIMIIRRNEPHLNGLASVATAGITLLKYSVHGVYGSQIHTSMANPAISDRGFKYKCSFYGLPITICIHTTLHLYPMYRYTK